MGARSCARSLRSHGAWLTSDVHGSSPRRAAPRPLLQVIPTGLRVVTSASLQNLVDYHILVGAPRLVLEATREAINMPGALDALSGALGSKLAMHAANLFVDDYFNGFTRVATDMGFEAGCGAPVLEDVELAGLDALRGGGLAATKKVKVVDNLSYDGEPSLMYCTGSIYSRLVDPKTGAFRKSDLDELVCQGKNAAKMGKQVRHCDVIFAPIPAASIECAGGSSG